MTAPIIEMKNIEKHFGAVIALSGVSLDVVPGECHCLLGDNGAGKSTFIKTMSGVHKPSAGEIFFEGEPLNFARPRDAIAAGIATVYQDLAMIPLMSVTAKLFHGQRADEKGRRNHFFRPRPRQRSDDAGNEGHGHQPCARRIRRSAPCRAANARRWRSPVRCISAPRC